MSTDWWGVEEPEWYKQLLASTPEGESPEYVKIGLDEFCGRFDLTPGKAKAEIRRCQLWNCGVHPFRNFPARLRMPDEIGKDPFQIPLPEADRYAAIIEAEKQQEAPPPCNSSPYTNKKHHAYSGELEAAVSCWLALYADAAPGTIRLIGRDEISKWLKENRPKAVVSKAALDRVVTIVNPKENKGGGAKPTP